VKEEEGVEVVESVVKEGELVEVGVNLLRRGLYLKVFVLLKG